VISAHVALLAVVMSAKMDLPQRIFHPPTTVVNFPKPDPTPPPTGESRPQTQPTITSITHATTQPFDNLPVDTAGATVNPGPTAGAGSAVIPVIPKTVLTPIHHDPRLLTPASEIKPPYPASKLLSEEEAVLTLRLTIDDRGRVVAVDPIGRADRAFLDAARRHLIAHWRYQPATEDDRAIASSITVTLRFELDG
jgi:protein TonB